MKMFRKYGNRKLYDRDTKSYIVLDHIVQLIKKGVDVKVLAHPTNEDVTNETLMSAIHDKCIMTKEELVKVILSSKTV